MSDVQKLGSQRESPLPFQEVIDVMNRASLTLRSHLSPAAFESAAYQANVKKREVAPDPGFQIDHERFGGGPEIEILELSRGIFTFQMIEENGQLRILTIAESR